jgi:hypothetical protein
VARAVPGGNVIVEALAGEGVNLSTALRPVQPAFGIIANALEGKDSWGNEIEGANFLELAARGAVSLSPLTRPLRDDIGPERSDVSKLFAEIEDREGNLAEQITPDVMVDLDDERETIYLSKLLDQASKRPTASQIRDASSRDELAKLRRHELRADKAQARIDALMVKYELKSAEEIEQEGEEYGDKYSTVKYPKPKKQEETGGLRSGGGLGGPGGL